VPLKEHKIGNKIVKCSKWIEAVNQIQFSLITQLAAKNIYAEVSEMTMSD
jgi:hypothetical protein